jgi:hypothetical protein
MAALIAEGLLEIDVRWHTDNLESSVISFRCNLPSLRLVVQLDSPIIFL